VNVIYKGAVDKIKEFIEMCKVVIGGPRNQLCQISIRSVRGFWSRRWPKITISHWRYRPCKNMLHSTV